MGKKSKGLGFGGVIVGLILIPGSLYLTYNAAHRAQASDALGGAVHVSAKKTGQAFYATGTVRPRKIGDKEFLVEKGPFLELGRKVEVYAWYGKGGKKKLKKYKKKKKKNKYKKRKKKKKKKSSYKCKKGWVAKPKNDKAFRKSCEVKGKPFTAKKISDKKKKVAKITIKDSKSGKEYSVAPGDLDIAIESSNFSPSQIRKYIKEDASLLKKDDKFKIIKGGFLDPDTCDIDNPKKIGCHKITFYGVIADPKAQYTVIGGSMKRDDELDRDQIGPFVSNGKSFLKLCKGDVKTCQGEMAKKDSRGTYIWVAGSILAFFIGLILVTNPLTNLIERIPVIGGLGSGLLKVIFFFLSIFVMGAMFILFKYWWAVLAGLVVLVVIAVVLKRK